MAVNISNDWTLQRVVQNVRSQSATISAQKKLVIDPQVIDLIHASIVDVRRAYDKLVDKPYEMNSAVTFTGSTPNFTSDLGTLKTTNGFYSLERVSLYDGTLGKIPVVPRDIFDALRGLYASADVGSTAAFGTIYSSGIGAPTCAVYSGAAAISTATLTWIRNVIKVTAKADTVDLPDALVPLAIDVATLKVFSKAGEAPPADVNQRVAANAQMIAGMLGASMPQQAL